jgi:phosphoglycolate phosphatase
VTDRPRPRALVFDLDGTLIDSRRDIADAANHTRLAFGLPSLPLEEIVPMIGDGARALVARAFGYAEDDRRVDERLAAFKARYADRPSVHTTLLPGAVDALRLGIPCALVTNKPRAITLLVLEALGIEAPIRAIWAGDDGPLKPDPTGVRAVLATLGVAPADAWMIGDGPQDILAGKAAGCYTIAVPGIADRERVLATAPDLVAESLADVTRLVTADRA